MGTHVVRGNCEVSLEIQRRIVAVVLPRGLPAVMQGGTPTPYGIPPIRRSGWLACQPLSAVLAGRSFLALHGAVTRDNRFLFASDDETDFLEELQALNAIETTIDSPDLFCGALRHPFCQNRWCEPMD